MCGQKRKETGHRAHVFGKMGNPDHHDRGRVIHQALDAGINFVDSADVHGYSETEDIVGKALPRHRMGVLVWSPLAMGLLTGRCRKGTAHRNNARMHRVPKHLADERKLDAVEQLQPIAEQAGIPLTHLALAFATTHPDITSANIGPRTANQPEDLLAGAGTTLDDDVLDRIDAIVPPGTDISPWTSPAYPSPSPTPPCLGVLPTSATRPVAHHGRRPQPASGHLARTRHRPTLR